jgi:hypothetical protein
MVTCPPNVKPGQKIRFQLPIQLSQQQLEAIRVNYDKVGAADMGTEWGRAFLVSFACATHGLSRTSLPPSLRRPRTPPIGRTAGCAAWARTSSSTGCTTSPTPPPNRHVPPPLVPVPSPRPVLSCCCPHQASFCVIFVVVCGVWCVVCVAGGGAQGAVRSRQHRVRTRNAAPRRQVTNTPFNRDPAPRPCDASTRTH